MITRWLTACAVLWCCAAAQAADYAQVHAILAKSCIGCHGARQSRSGLRLDTADGIKKGGEHGPAVIPGFPADSAIYARCCLPSDDPDAMPAKGARLNAEDLQTISAWILAGAKAPAEPAAAAETTVAAASPPAHSTSASPSGGAGAATGSGTGDAMGSAGATMEQPGGGAMAAGAMPGGTMAPSAPAPSAAPGTAGADGDGALSATADADFAPVKAIFASACIQCHGPNKQKGKLRLDSPASVRAGGKSGAAVIPGAPERSLLVTRIGLPADDPDIMPADGPHLNPAQIATVVAWIKAGAWSRAPAGSSTFVPPLAPGAPGAGVQPATPAKAFNPMDAPDTELDKLAAGMAKPDAKALDALVADGMWWRPVCKNGALIELDCRQIGAAEVGRALAKLGPLAEHVVWLNLAGTGVADGDLDALAAIKHLERLHLERTAIGDAGMAHLAPCRELSYLNLYGSQVGDAGIMKLAPLTHLAQLFLRDSKATPEGGAKLKAAIPGLAVVFDEELPTGPLPEKKKNKKGN